MADAAEHLSSSLRTARIAVGVVLVALGIAGIALGLWVVVNAYSPVPFADFWFQFDFLMSAQDRDVGLDDLWAQANEHRILVPRLQFVLDYELFDGTYVFLFSAIVASALLLAAVFAAIAWWETRDALIALGTFSAAATGALSPVAIENLTWSFQVQFVQVFLFATVSVAALALAARPDQRRTWWWLGACAFAGTAATYSMANGLLVWPVVVSLGLVLGMRGLRIGLLALVGLAATTSYVWHLRLTESSVSDPLRLLAYAAAYLGSAFRGAGTSGAVIVGLLGAALLGLLCLLTWRRRGDSGVAMPFGAGVGAYVGLTALQTAVGRLESFDVSQALSPRYALGSFTFWLALLVGFTPVLQRAFGRYSQALVPAMLAAAAAVALVVGLRALPDYHTLRETVLGKEATVLAYLAGVDDSTGTLTGGAPDAVVRETFDWMRVHGVGPWASGGIAHEMQFRFPEAGKAPACEGRVEYVEPVRGGLRLRGWLVPPAGSDHARNLAVRDAEGSPVGRGRIGTYRPDIGDSGLTTSNWTGFVAYARHTPPLPLAVLLVEESGGLPACRLETTP